MPTPVHTRVFARTRLLGMIGSAFSIATGVVVHLSDGLGGKCSTKPFLANGKIRSAVLQKGTVWPHIHTARAWDQPGKVVNPARGQLNRENEYFPVRVRA